MAVLLLLSRFSRVRLCATPEMAAHQAPPSLGFRTLKWVAISFSNAWKWKVKVKLLSHVPLLVTPWTAAYQAPPSMGFSRQETGVGRHCLLQMAVQATSIPISQFIPNLCPTPMSACPFPTSASLFLPLLVKSCFHNYMCGLVDLYLHYLRFSYLAWLGCQGRWFLVQNTKQVTECITSHIFQWALDINILTLLPSDWKSKVCE